MAEGPVVIRRADVQRLLLYSELIPALEEALGKFSKRDSAAVIQPVRTTVPLQKHHGFFGVMPAYMEQDGILCTKMVVCFYKREPGSDLPSTQSTVLLLDPQVGDVKAVSAELLK
ncbi:ketimine reductase mu-crystallin-like [Thalassophryne amazonica]|uniref:ketimine reductase mu-crystallin-like n=1 Tax=Thalassophryne amazonica TaxID=390379 RepID=UPI001471BE09|nr:ketimine reductase mu-crystallin-like [Thalassophryne amazonica]